MAWTLSALSSFLGKDDSLLFFLSSGGREDKYPNGWSPRQLREEPFPTNIRLACANTFVTTPPPAPHQSWIRANFTQQDLRYVARFL